MLHIKNIAGIEADFNTFLSKIEPIQALPPLAAVLRIAESSSESYLQSVLTLLLAGLHFTAEEP